MARKTNAATDAVMSTGAFVVSSLVMIIPIVGLIIYIVWACGGCQNLNRRNFARAMLILLVIGVIFSAIMYALTSSLLGNLPGMFGVFEQLGNM